MWKCLLIALVTMVACLQAAGQTPGVIVLVPNLVGNPYFGAGNSEFTSGYTYNATSLLADGTYTVGTNPSLYNPDAPSFGNHTPPGTSEIAIVNGSILIGPPSPEMLIVNGSTVADVAAWQETVPVTAQTSYNFGAWAASWSEANIYGYSTPNLKILINGNIVGEAVQLPSADGQWIALSASWNSGSCTSALIQIVDENTAALGNDFTLDDISFAAQIPEPNGLCLIGLVVLALNWRARRGELITRAKGS